jgi:hypothetical protein
MQGVFLSCVGGAPKRTKTACITGLHPSGSESLSESGSITAGISIPTPIATPMPIPTPRLCDISFTFGTVSHASGAHPSALKRHASPVCIHRDRNRHRRAFRFRRR